jgi:hypothetical protein
VPSAHRNLGRRLRLTLACCSLLVLASCGQNQRPALVAVQGQVFLENTPAHRAVVWLQPLEPALPAAPRPRGVVDEDGNFSVGTYKPKDGAPAGKYRAAIFWRAPVKAGDEDGPSLIPERYMDAATSGLPVVEVQSEPVTLPAFRLTKN